MAVHLVNSFAVVFEHVDYGKRLLLQSGLTNPRNQLGKNGLSLHNSFSAFFYKTITIEVKSYNQQQEESNAKFYVNRNSLIKYLQDPTLAKCSDEELITFLNAKLEKEPNSTLNDAPTIPNASASSHGEALLHAGNHHQYPLKNNLFSFFYRLKAFFLEWLYQKSLSGLNWMKMRFFFLNKEQDLFEAGALLAKKRFEEAVQQVPAYKEHIDTHPLDTEAVFRNIEPTHSKNYLKQATHDSNLYNHGRYPNKGKAYPANNFQLNNRSWDEIKTLKKRLRITARMQFGPRPLFYINTFPHASSSNDLKSFDLNDEKISFLTLGPQKKQIIEYLNKRLEYYAIHVHEHILNLSPNNPIPETQVKSIQEFIENTLYRLLLDSQSTLDTVVESELMNSSAAAQNIIYPYLESLRAVITKLDLERPQFIIAGDPSFLKDLYHYAISVDCNLNRFKPIGYIEGQTISEALRTELLTNGFRSIHASYSHPDIDINFGIETPFEIKVRKTIESNPGLARELYGSNRRIPMIFQFDPLHTHIETSGPENEDLLITCTTNNRASPRIRFKPEHVTGRIYAASDIQALCTKYGTFAKPQCNLPIVLIWEPNSIVHFKGITIAFSELEQALAQININDEIYKKAFYSYKNDAGDTQLELWLELKEGLDLPPNDQATDYATQLIQQLTQLNQEFRHLLHMLDDDSPLPGIRLFRNGQSLIKHTNSMHKQTKLFTAESLPPDYKFPDETQCMLVSLVKDESLLNIIRAFST